MSDNLAAAVAALGGAPEALVMRSAHARAAASGSTADAVLAAWTGGESIPVAASSPTAVTPTAAAAPAPAAAPKAAPAATAVVPEPIVIEIPEEEEDPIEPPALRDRLRQGFRIGSFIGALGGVLVSIYLLSTSYDSLGVTEGIATAAVTPGRMLLAVAAISAVTGVVISGVSLGVPVVFDRNFRTESQSGVSRVTGLVAGALLGAILGAFLVGRGFADVVDESIVHLAVGSTFFFSLIGSAITGGIIGMVVQMTAIPEGLDEGERAAALAVRKRLATGYLAPVAVILVIAVGVVTLGTILLNFHALAPVIAIVVSGAILAFGFLSGGRPKIRVGRTEVLVVVATLAVLVYFMVLITNAMFGSGH